MTEKEKLESLVLDVIEEMNQHEFVDNPLPREHETPLFGKSGQLDSLNLVMLIMAIEDSTEENLGHRLSLADDRAMSREKSPFRTIGSLIDYMAEISNDS